MLPQTWLNSISVNPQFHLSEITSGPPFSGQSDPNGAAAAQRVRAQKNAGYDFLKIASGLSPDVFDAVTTTARKIGMPFAGHVTASVGLKACLQARQVTIDHLDGYIKVLVPDI